MGKLDERWRFIKGRVFGCWWTEDGRPVVRLIFQRKEGIRKEEAYIVLSYDEAKKLLSI